MFLGFWIQYPLGTRLSLEFVIDRVRITGLYGFLNGAAAIRTGFSLYLTQFALLFPSYFRLCINFYHDIFVFSQSRLVRVSLLISYLLINTVLFLPIWLSVFAFGIAAFTVLLIVTIGVIAVWSVGLLASFLVWLFLYRIPVYDIVLPRISTWMLRHNSAVYRRLPLAADMSGSYIRLVRIKPGSSLNVIDCELITENLATADFDALSYVWGVTILPYKINVDGNNFYVTYNLLSALRELRQPDRNRLIWIDALCINQADDIEKSNQVRLMKTIYSKASEVIVWLGTDSKATTTSFNLARQFRDARTEEDRNQLWAEATSSRSWRRIRTEFHRVLSHEWWTRAWIIQEVVVAQRVLVRRGSAQLDWDTLQALFEYRPFQEMFWSDGMNFAEEVQELRNGRFLDNATPTTLFDLVYRFRDQLATLGSDKIYALLGLLPPGYLTAVYPDYSKSPEQVFLDFTLASIAENKTFTVVALAPGAALQGVSWCRDWRILNDGFGFNPQECFSMYDSPSVRSYCTVGTSEPRIEANLEKRVLKVKGFDLDVVAKRGEYRSTLGYRPGVGHPWTNLLSNWERIAGGPWSSSSDGGRSSAESFNRTIVADKWPEGIVDWKTQTDALNSSLVPEEESYVMAILSAGLNRRFFVTKKGRFGLGPQNLKVGDVVVAVLGSVVPLVLRQDGRNERKRYMNLFGGHQRPNESVPTSEMGAESQEEFWKVIGEAYCDGLMYYEGDIVKDIHDGKIEVKD